MILINGLFLWPGKMCVIIFESRNETAIVLWYLKTRQVYTLHLHHIFVHTVHLKRIEWFKSNWKRRSLHLIRKKTCWVRSPYLKRRITDRKRNLTKIEKWFALGLVLKKTIASYENREKLNWNKSFKRRLLRDKEVGFNWNCLDAHMWHHFGAVRTIE